MRLLSKYLYHLRLVICLVVMFVVQAQIFNSWVHLTPNPQFSLFMLESFTLGVFLYGPSIFLNKKVSSLYLLFISLIVSIFFVSQYLYFSYYGGFFQASALEYAKQVSSEWSTVLTLFTLKIFAFTINFFIVLYVFVIKKRHSYEYETELFYKKEKMTLLIAIIAIIIFGYGTLVARSENVWAKVSNPLQTLHDFNSFTYSPNDTVQKVGIGNYFLADVIGAVMRDKNTTVDDTTFVQNWFSQKIDKVSNKYFGIASKKNLIFIQVESLETAVIGQKIGDQEITPNLNKLSQEGAYFNNYYTQIGPGNTADAEFVTLNSLYPLTNEVAFIDFANNKYNALPDLLKQNGYHTYALHGDVPNFWNRANIYPDLGYEKAISKDDFTTVETGFENLSDDDFFSESSEKIETFEQPFMATMITLSSHTPFSIPEEYQKIKFSDDSKLTGTQKNYIQSIHYMDGALGSFINKLKKSGQYKNSFVVIYGDHGSFTNISEQMSTTKDPVLENIRSDRVPLILLNAKLNSVLNGPISTPGSHLDLYPTVANLLGIKAPQAKLGQDLLNTKIPVVTNRDPYNESITTILTPTLGYKSNTLNNVFEQGSCYNMATTKVLPITDCKKLYDSQAEILKISDLIINGNLIPSIK